MARAALTGPLYAPAPGKMLSVPAYTYVFGAAATAAAMIAAYYDRIGFTNIYAGPLDGGVMPAGDDGRWDKLADGTGTTYPLNPLVASAMNLDGRASRGSIEDYWVSYGSSASDPYITGGWTPHTWADAVGDYMKTSQSARGNTDGSTTFYNWASSANRLTCDELAAFGLGDQDGTNGLRLFYQARGYAVSDCYSQKSDNQVAGGFSLAQYKAEIDAGHPVLLNLTGHTLAGAGYDDTSDTIYVHDTWDALDHAMTWGASYAGMALLSVSIVHPVPAVPTGVTATDAAFTDKVRVSWSNLLCSGPYQVYRNTSDSSVGATLLGEPATSSFDDATAVPGTTYYYFVKACPGGICSAFSASDSGRAATAPTAPTVTASEGTFFDKVQISWTASAGVTSYEVFRSDTSSSSGATSLGTASSPFDDITASPGTVYYYFVKACDGSVCSDFSLGDSGYRSMSAPTGVSATDGTQPDKVDVSWTAADGASSYQVFRGSSASVADATQLDTAAASPYSDTTATPGAVYYYFVKACNGSVCSDFSLGDSGHRPMSAPTGVSATDGTQPDRVDVSWTAADGASSYQVFRGSSASVADATQLDTAAASPYSDTTATPGAIYYYFVKACSGSVCSDLSTSDSGYRAVQCSGPCSAGYYQTASCTAFNDRICTPCSVGCPAGTYLTAACSATLDRICLPLVDAGADASVDGAADGAVDGAVSDAGPSEAADGGALDATFDTALPGVDATVDTKADSGAVSLDAAADGAMANDASGKTSSSSSGCSCDAGRQPSEPAFMSLLVGLGMLISSRRRRRRE